MAVTVIQQKIIATNNFNATAPAGAPTHSKDIKRFAAEAAGGMFDFGITGPHIIRSVELILGGQSVWSVAKLDSEGDEVVIFSGTTEATFFSSNSDRPLMYEAEKLLVRTTGATGALKCRIALERE